MNHRKTHMDNRGFTLVELLIAVLILAIVVAPLLHTFVTASRTNLKARTNLRATTAAQDIMEGLKADTIEELAYQFNYPNVNATSNPLIKPENEFHIIRRGLINGDIKEVIASTDPTTGAVSYADVVKGETALVKTDVTASIYSDNYGVDYEFLGQKTSGKYYFVMEDVTLENTNFDAIIELDAMPYRGAATDPTMHNAKEVVNIMDMSNVYDAFYVEQETDVDNALQNMNLLYPNPTHVLTEADIERTITIDVTQSVVGPDTVTKAHITYEYKERTNPAHVYKSLDEQMIFNNSSSKRDLQDIYLFYYPLYDAAPDTIIYNNDQCVPITYHIIKQEPSNTVGLMSDEMSYQCTVHINELGSTGISTSATKLRTNIDTNLMSVYDSTITTPIAGVQYRYNGAIKNKSDLVAEEKYEDLAGMTEMDRLFDITIKVYRAGANDAGFPEESRLVTIRGSKNN